MQQDDAGRGVVAAQRRRAGGRRRHHARLRPHVVQETRVEGDAVIAGRVRRAGQVDAHRHQARRRRSPASTSCSRAKLRRSRPAPISSATESATSATVRSERRRWRATPRCCRAWPRAACRPAASRDACSAGTSPKTNDENARQRQPRRPSTLRSNETSSSRGTPSGPNATSSADRRGGDGEADAAGEQRQQQRFGQQLPDDPPRVRRRARRESRAPSDARRRARAGGWRRCRRR